MRTILAVLFLTAAAGGTTRYISLTGNDANACTTSARCASVNRAYQLSTNGDTIMVAAGTYNSVQTLASNGMGGTNSLTPVTATVVTIKPESGRGTVTFNTDFEFGPTFTGTRVKHIEIQDITMEWTLLRSAEDIHFTRVNWISLFQVDCADYMSIQQSEMGPFSTNIGDGFDFYGPSYVSCSAGHVGNWLLEDTIIHDLGVTDAQAHADSLALDGGDVVIVRRNKFYRNCGMNFRMSAQSPPTNITVENNWIAPNISAGCAVSPLAAVQFLNVGSIIRYNTIDGDIQLGLPSSLLNGELWEGNLITGNVQFNCPTGTGTVSRFNVWGTSNDAGCGTNNIRVTDYSGFTGWFVNPPTDYSLTSAGLAAVGAGNPASFPATDIRGFPRPAGGAPDAGAFEFGATSGGGGGAAPAITTGSPLTAGRVGVVYSLQFAGTGDTGGTCTGCTWTATGVPGGLTLSSSGLLSGVPTAAATSTISVTATNATGSAGPTAFSLTVAPIHRVRMTSVRK